MQGQIILASIYRNKYVLADYTLSNGTFETIALEVAGQTQNEKGKFSFTKGQYVFHVLSDQTFVFLCMADINYMRADAYSFLEQLKRLLYEKCNTQQAMNAVNYGLQKTLRPDIKQKFELFNSPEASKLRTAQHNLEILKDVVVQNLDKVLERNEKLELIVQKSQQMTVASSNMRSQATAIRRQQQCRKIKLYIIMALGGITAIYIILVIICGSFDMISCFGGSSDKNDDKNNKKNIITSENMEISYNVDQTFASEAFSSEGESGSRNRVLMSVKEDSLYSQAINKKPKYLEQGKQGQKQCPISFLKTFKDNLFSYVQSIFQTSHSSSNNNNINNKEDGKQKKAERNSGNLRQNEQQQQQQKGEQEQQNQEVSNFEKTQNDLAQKIEEQLEKQKNDQQDTKQEGLENGPSQKVSRKIQKIQEQLRKMINHN